MERFLGATQVMVLTILDKSSANLDHNYRRIKNEKETEKFSPEVIIKSGKLPAETAAILWVQIFKYKSWNLMKVHE